VPIVWAGFSSGKRRDVVTYGTGGLGVMVMFLSWNTSVLLPQSVHSIGCVPAKAGAASGSSTMTVTRSGLAVVKAEKRARRGAAA
jgi:hypothetical protein